VYGVSNVEMKYVCIYFSEEEALKIDLSWSRMFAPNYSRGP